MNKQKLPVLGFSLLLLIASCKKNDIQQTSVSSNNPSATTKAAQTTEWKSLNNWTTLKGDKVTTYSSEILDSSITADIAKSGMVLAFAKNNGTIQQLPFQQKGSNDSYWYYEVSKGSISIFCDSYAGTANLSASGFTYFILSTQRLNDLETSGYSKIKLMQTGYEDLVKILKK